MRTSCVRSPSHSATAGTARTCSICSGTSRPRDAYWPERAGLPQRAAGDILSAMTQYPILVTGGAGFIGSAVVRRLVRAGDSVVNVDSLTYAGNIDSLADAAVLPNYHFEQADIADAHALARIFNRYQPRAVLHLAAESHVDRSIDAPDAFIQTNLVGTFHLL